MIVEVLYFASVKEALQIDRERVALEPGARSVANLLTRLGDLHAPIKGNLRGIRVAVNEEFRDLSFSLSDGDVVALIPPVSGG